MLKKFHENFAKQNKNSVYVKIVFMNNIKLLLAKSYKNKENCVCICFYFKKQYLSKIFIEMQFVSKM